MPMSLYIFFIGYDTTSAKSMMLFFKNFGHIFLFLGNIYVCVPNLLFCIDLVKYFNFNLSNNVMIKRQGQVINTVKFIFNTQKYIKSRYFPVGVGSDSKLRFFNVSYVAYFQHVWETGRNGLVLCRV